MSIPPFLQGERLVMWDATLYYLYRYASFCFAKLLIEVTARLSRAPKTEQYPLPK